MSFTGGERRASVPHHEKHHPTEGADSLLANRLPVVAREAVRIRTVTQKKKGVAGWFGGKKKVQVFEPSKRLQELNDKLVAMQEERDCRIDAYADSLRKQNKALNQKLNMLVTHLDGQHRPHL